MYNLKKFHVLLDELVEQNRVLRASKLPDASFSSDYNTVTCDIGRGAGKSEWIRLRATENDLIVTMDLDTAHASFSKKQTNATVLTAHALCEAKGRRFNTVFVDEPRYVFKVFDLTEFYTLLAVDPDVTFVFLGTR